MIIKTEPENLQELVRGNSFQIDTQRYGNAKSLLRSLQESDVPEPRLRQQVWLQGPEIVRFCTNSLRKARDIGRWMGYDLFSQDYSSYKELNIGQLEEFDVEPDKPFLLLNTRVGLRAYTLDDAILMTDAKRIHREFPDISDALIGMINGSQRRINIYDGCITDMDTKRFSDPNEPVWSPSIDTDLLRLLVQVVKERGYVPSVVNVAGEMGYASGAIAKYQREILEPDVSLLFDINKNAKICAGKILTGKEIEFCGKDFFSIDEDKIKFFEGDGIHMLQFVANVDVMTCNPPYLPKDDSLVLQDDANRHNIDHYEGIRVPIELIKRADDYLSKQGQLLINLSSHSFTPKMYGAFKTAHEKGLNSELVMKKRVPLKIYDLQMDRRWQDHLGVSGQKPERGYSHWQELYFIRIYR